MKKIKAAIFSLSIIASIASAQTDQQFTMHMFNRHVINPAYAGSLGALNVTGAGRSQWLGIEGHPETFSISAHGLINKISSGVGGTIIADRLGQLSTLGANVSYAFHLKFSEKAKLNIGVNGGIYQKRLDGTNWDYDRTIPDPILQDAVTSTIVPDLGAGLYFHIERQNNLTDAYPQDKFYVGAYVGHILEPSLNDLLRPGAATQSNVPMEIHFNTGYAIDIDQNLILQPNVNFRMAGPLYMVDLNANLYVSPMVFGLSYRTSFSNSESMSGILGFNANSRLFFGYSYDFNIGRLASVTSGSHEVIISYTLPTKIRRPVGLDGVRGK